MTDEEYRKFMAVLMRRHVRPRLPRLRRRFHHHMMDGDDIYDTISPARVTRAVSETRHSLDFSNRTLEESGFLDAFEPHMRDILDGLRPAHIPVIDQEVIRNTGSPDAEAEWQSWCTAPAPTEPGRNAWPKRCHPVSSFVMLLNRSPGFRRSSRSSAPPRRSSHVSHPRSRGPGSRDSDKSDKALPSR